MNKTDKIYIAGHTGLVGSAILNHLQKNNYTNLIYKTHKELDLTNQSDTKKFFENEKPDYVFLAAAKVGGIHVNNTYPADFIYQNIQIQSNVIHNAYLNNVKKLLFLGSVCIYPKYAPEPVKEESLLSSALEPTNEPYAIAKISGIKMCQSYRKQYNCDFITIMPCNLYGVNDNFNLLNSHVIPALMRKFYEAKINNLPNVICWGDGSARREFMCSDDAANAAMFLMKNYSSNEIINIGVGKDYTIKEVTELIKNIVGYNGTITWDTSKPNGTPKRLMDLTKINQLEWKPSIEIETGLENMYKWFSENYEQLKHK